MQCCDTKGGFPAVGENRRCTRWEGPGGEAHGGAHGGRAHSGRSRPWKTETQRGWRRTAAAIGSATPAQGVHPQRGRPDRTGLRGTRVPPFIAGSAWLWSYAAKLVVVVLLSILWPERVIASTHKHNRKTSAHSPSGAIRSRVSIRGRVRPRAAQRRPDAAPGMLPRLCAGLPNGHPGPGGIGGPSGVEREACPRSGQLPPLSPGVQAGEPGMTLGHGLLAAVQLLHPRPSRRTRSTYRTGCPRT